MAQVLAVIAVGAAAVSFVGGVGVYLYIRFTQHRQEPPRRSGPSPRGSWPTA